MDSLQKQDGGLDNEWRCRLWYAMPVPHPGGSHREKTWESIVSSIAVLRTYVAEPSFHGSRWRRSWGGVIRRQPITLSISLSEMQINVAEA